MDMAISPAVPGVQPRGYQSGSPAVRQSGSAGCRNRGYQSGSDVSLKQIVL